MAAKKAPAKSATSLASIQEEINKLHGTNVLAPLGDNADLTVDRISTGVLAVDQITGGGFPVGQMIELYGPHGSGKTSIAMSFLAEVQKKGKLAILLDLEHAFDPRMAINAGIDVATLWVAQPESAEDALDLIERVMVADDVGAIVVDSVAGLVPAAEIAGDFGDSHMGLTARLMSQALRKLAAVQRKEHPDVIIVWINQIREKIGVQGYGPKTDSTGGRGLKFWASTRLEVSRTENIKKGESEIIGHKVKVKTTKNRHAAPFQTTVFDIYYDWGISNESTLLDMCIVTGAVKQSGAWFTNTLTGEQIGQGRAKAIDAIRQDEDLRKMLMAHVDAELDV
jgi:recombination protein RecA